MANSLALPQLTTGAGIKDFITSKEKKLGTVGTLIIFGVAGYFLLPVVLPQVVNILGLINTSFSYLTAILIKALALGVALFVLMQPRTWTLGWHVYNMISRATSKLLLKIGGIERLEAYAHEYLGSKMATVMSSLNKITGEKKNCERRIKTYREQIADAREKAEALKEHHYDEATRRWETEDYRSDFQRHSVNISMWEKTLRKFEAQLKGLEIMEGICRKFQRGYSFYIDMIRATVENLKIEYEANKGMAEAANAISSTVGEGDDFSRFFNEGVEYFGREIARFEANVENFMQLIPEFTRGVDLMEETAESRLMAQLEAIDVTADTQVGAVENQQRLLMEGGKEGLLAVAHESRKAEPVPVKPAGRYKDLL